MDNLFSALANPIRRNLLDRLREEDGQTQTQLEQFQPVTRFGLMKHLAVLEQAGLITTRKVGREKRHYLNPIPIQEMADRWVSRFAAPFARTINDLTKAVTEKETAMSATRPSHVWETYIRATPAEVWAILTDDEKTPLWKQFNMTSVTDWRVGGAITFFVNDHAVIVGEILAIEKPHRFVHTFQAQWSPDVAHDQVSRVTWQLEPAGDAVCRLVLTHDNFGGDSNTSKSVVGGWQKDLARLKTLAESGIPLLIS